MPLSFFLHLEHFSLVSAHSQRIVEVWTKIVDLIRESHLYDETVLPLVVQWLTAMSTSDIRALRHTATFLALKLLTKLCQVIAKVAETLNIFTRQGQASSQKKTPKKGKVDVSKVDELTEHHTFLTAQIEALYTGYSLFSFFFFINLLCAHFTC